MAANMVKSAIVALVLAVAGNAQAASIAVCQVKLLKLASDVMEKATPDKYANMGYIWEITTNMRDRRPKVVFFGEGLGEKPQCLIQVIMQEAKKPEAGEPCPEYKFEEIDITCP